MYDSRIAREGAVLSMVGCGPLAAAWIAGPGLAEEGVQACSEGNAYERIEIEPDGMYRLSAQYD